MQTPTQIRQMMDSVVTLIPGPAETTGYNNWLIEGRLDGLYTFDFAFGIFVNEDMSTGNFTCALRTGKNPSEGKALVHKLLGMKFERDLGGSLELLRKAWQGLSPKFREEVWL